MANKFEIRVQAIDEFTKVFRKLNTSASQAIRPVVTARRQLIDLGREMHVDKIARGFRNVSREVINVAEGIGVASGPMRAVFGLGAAGGIVATAAAIGKLSTRWGTLGFEVNRTANATGYSTDVLQKYVGAAKLAGVSSDSITGSLAGVARTMQDIRGGRNQDASKLANIWGINENDSNVKVMEKLSNILQKTANPQLREKIAEFFSLDIGSLPLLSQGPDAVANLQEKAKQLGLVMSPEQIRQANEYALAMFQLEAAFSGLANTLGAKLGPSLAKTMNALNRRISGQQDWGFGDMLKGLAIGADWMSPGGGVKLSSQAAARVGSVAGVSISALPIGLRNNNPGNLRIPGSTTGFQKFASAQEGLAAMAQQIGRYQNRDGLNTIGGIVGKWAPPSENQTGAYVADVSRATGFSPGQAINVNDPAVMSALMAAMIRHENGQQPFSQDQLKAAAQSVQIHVNVANAPPGTRVTATGGEVARISYAMPGGTMP